MIKQICDNLANLFLCIDISCFFHLRKAYRNYRPCSLQLTVFIFPARRLFLPYEKPLKKFPSACIFHREKLLQHTHIQGFPESSRPCNQRHVIIRFPPLFDEMSFIHIEIMVHSYFFKILFSYTYRPAHNIISIKKCFAAFQCSINIIHSTIQFGTYLSV